MKRYDLRELHADFMPRMVELINTDIQDDEVAIFIFEIGDFSAIQATADMVKENNWTLMNSLKFNEVDWTVVIKKDPKILETQEDDEDNSEDESAQDTSASEETNSEKQQETTPSNTDEVEEAKESK